MNTTEETTTETPAQRLTAAAESLGLSLECSAPMPGVDGDKDKAWPHIAYTVTMKRNGSPVWAGPYKLGVGHVSMANGRQSWTVGHRLTEAEESLLRSLKAKPHATALNAMTHASLAAKLAVQQKVSPSLPDVLHSLLSDGEVFFDGQTFEDWATNYGYDTDSRKAEEIYRTCDTIGRTLQGALGRKAIETLREAAQDY